LPTPTGRAEIGTTTLHLVDSARKDPWKPDRQREMMVSVWYPARDTAKYPQAPWATAGVVPWLDGFGAGIGIPQGSVDWTSAKTDGHVGAPAVGRRPVVLYSPGFSAPRFAGAVLAGDLASQGYIVVAIDHTFETVVEFPGGRVEWPVEVEAKQALAARVGDTRFVLDELADLSRGRNPDAEGKPLPRGLGNALDLSKVGMFGHSYGGFTAGETMYYDRRIDAGINLDGGMPDGEITRHGVDGPFLLMGGQYNDEGEPQDHTHLTDPSWRDFWANQRAWKRDVLLEGSGHYSFTDLQAILPQLPGTWTPFIGSIDPAKSLNTQSATIRGFFECFLH
jgi:dienelactone hydrolase